MAIKTRSCDNCSLKTKHIYAVSYGRCVEMEEGEPIAIDQSQEFLCRHCMKEIGRILSRVKNKRW